MKRWLTWAGVGLLVAGCGREPAPEAAGAPLARPVIALAVKPGRGRDGEIEILSGLHGTETLVLGDLREVRDGSPVKILENADKRR